MVTISILYPTAKGARFDVAYYSETTYPPAPARATHPCVHDGIVGFSFQRSVLKYND